jgi:hypothetical protein
MKKFNLTQKRWLLIAHIAFTCIWFGVTVTFLVLSIAASTTNDENVLTACYTVMHLLSESSGRASIIGTVVTGIILSVFTQWGFFKYRWIIVKEMMTILSIGLGMIAIYIFTLKGFTIVSAEGFEAMQNQAFISSRWQLYVGIILQIITLLMMIIISVFKPWGKLEEPRVIF